MIPSKKFDKKYFSSGYYRNYGRILAEWVRPMARRIHRIFKNDPSAKILDIGCSYGNLIAELQDKYHFSIQGLDCSSYVIKKACPSVRKKIKKGNILKLPFRKNTFDLVICFDVINYLNLEEARKAIKNLVGVSRKYIFFNSIYRHSRDASQKINPDPLRRTVLTKKEYINIFAKNRAKLIKKFWSANGGDVLIFEKR